MWNKKTEMCNRKEKYHNIEVFLPEKCRQVRKLDAAIKIQFFLYTF